jgi:hypothetical protein
MFLLILWAFPDGFVASDTFSCKSEVFMDKKLSLAITCDEF